MDIKKILSWIALLGGEAIIIAAFILLRGDLTDHVLVLNIVVSSLIYGLFFIDILVSWIDFGDKSQKRVGSIGLRWFFTWSYAILAVATMILSSLVFDFTFAVLLIIHAALLFLLLLGFISVFTSSDKVQEVYLKENANRSRIAEIKRAITSLKDKMNDSSNLPESFINRINALEENVRFISPTNNQEAHDLEEQFITTINDMAFAVSNFSMNEERIESSLKKCERICQNRKNMYSI
ncbi:MAG: hypothetical protein LBR26_08485 [Prevotella sp.]|jgi:hypothetical protein|nr:hypothetical protein [Prevotella sp.]